MAKHRFSPAGAALVVALALTAACGPADRPGAPPTAVPDAAASPPPTTTSTTAVGAAGGRRFEVREWDGLQLPTAMSPVAAAGGTGVYFADVGRRPWLVALDLATGEERWRRRVDQLGRPTNWVEAPLVDPAAGAAYATTLAGDLPHLTAFRLATGAPLWSAETVWAGRSPELCSGGAVCVLPSDEGDEIWVHDARTGEVVTGTLPPLPEMLHLHGGLLLTRDPAGGSVELGAIGYAGYHPRWRHPLSAFVPGEAAGRYGEGSRWASQIMADTGRVFFSFGADDEAFGDLTGVVSPSGAILLRVDGARYCGFGLDDDRVVLCAGLATEPAADAGGGGHAGGDGEGPGVTFDRLVTYELGTGAVVSTVVLPGPLPLDYDQVRHTSDPELVVVGAGAGASVFDLDARSLVPAADAPPGLLVPCPAPEGDARPDLHAELEAWDGEVLQYAVPDPEAGLCTLDARPVAAPEVLGRGGTLPWWFGLTYTSASQQKLGLGASTPAVWMDGDRRLHGLHRGPG